MGASCAGLLVAGGLRVALVEARPAPQSAQAEKPDGTAVDIRVSALSPASTRILAGIGAWQAIPADRRVGFQRMVVWDAGGRGEVRFDAAELGTPALGYIVENHEIVAALEGCLAQGVTQFRPGRVVGLDRPGRGVELRLADHRRITARLTVGADGSQSGLRKLAGIETKLGGYGQTAVVATLEITGGGGHRDTAWQRFLPSGPIALLPLPGDRVSMVWSTEPAEAERLLDLSGPRFADEVSVAVEHRLGALRLDSARASFPLHHLRAARYVDERVALLGDAAHTIHPLAGQGVNLGLLDAAALAEVVVDLQAWGRDIGRKSNLRRYERWRKGHNQLMHHAMNGFHRLFGSELSGLRAARNFGFRMTDRAPVIKRLFMQAAAGSLGEVPRIARNAARLD